MKSATKNNRQEVRKLTPHDLAFGIGRKATDDELELLFEDMENEEFYSVDEVKKYIETNLKKQQHINKKNATTKV